MKHLLIDLPRELRKLKIKETIVMSSISRALLVFEEERQKKRK